VIERSPAAGGLALGLVGDLPRLFPLAPSCDSAANSLVGWIFCSCGTCLPSRPRPLERRDRDTDFDITIDLKLRTVLVTTEPRSRDCGCAAAASLLYTASTRAPGLGFSPF